MLISDVFSMTGNLKRIHEDKLPEQPEYAHIMELLIPKAKRDALKNDTGVEIQKHWIKLRRSTTDIGFHIGKPGGMICFLVLTELTDGTITSLAAPYSIGKINNCEDVWKAIEFISEKLS